MIITRLLTLALLALLPSIAQAQAAAAAPSPLRSAGDRPVDIRHLKLELDVDLKRKRISGTATLDLVTLRPLTTIRLDAVNHQVTAVRGRRGEDKPVVLEFENTGREILVHLKARAAARDAWQLAIDYSVTNPDTGLHFFGPSKTTPKQPLMVWSHGEPISNRYWFPSQDHPAERQSSEIIATVPTGMECLSNGKLISRKMVEGTQPGEQKIRFHWKQQKSHVSYLTTLVVGRFHVAREQWRGRPVLYYVPPESAPDTARTFGRTVEMLDFFSDTFGIEYPWEKYAQVVVEQFTAGGMENTSATTLYRGVMHDERAMLDSTPDRLIAHELGHQWWGDLVTCRNWSHLWLNEGFATYCEVLWYEHKLGRDEADYLLYSKSRSGRSGAALTRPIVDRHYASPRSMFDSRAYPKAGWVLHMLRHRVGDDAFFRALKRYGTVYSYQVAETGDLRRTFERLLGHSLERFFFDWTERSAHPVLTVSSRYDADSKQVRVEVTQDQDGEPFAFPLRVSFAVPGRSEPVRLDLAVTEKRQVAFVPVGSRPTLVRVDPEHTLLAEVKEKKSRGWWVAQLKKAPRVPERLRAVAHFATSRSEADRKLLFETLAGDKFYGVRVAAAGAVGRVSDDLSRPVLLAALQQENPFVRAAVAAALGSFAKNSEAAAVTEVADVLETAWSDGDPSYKVEAAVLRSLARIRPLPLKTLEKALKRESHRETIRQAALGALARHKDLKAIEILLSWTTPDRPRRCRMAAIAGLGQRVTRAGTPDSATVRVVKALTGLLEARGPRIRGAALQAMRRLGHSAKAAEEVVASLAEHDPEGRVRVAARAALKALQQEKTATAELDRLRGELDSLRKRNQDLADRLKKLEAK
jgi:aminopeptidase N